MTKQTIIPKAIGYDMELGNVVLTNGRPVAGSDAEASSLLLARIEGYKGRYTRYSSRDTSGDDVATGAYSRTGTGKQQKRKRKKKKKWDVHEFGLGTRDFGRRWLANGSCVYIDCNKLEVTGPIVRSAFDHVASQRATIRTVQAAIKKTNDMIATRYQDTNVMCFAGNSDGQGNSWGSHMNFLMSREGYHGLFCKPHMLMFLAAFQASSVILTGQGKVGTEPKLPYCRYQLSQRADFIECFTSINTTFNRPMINTRDESLSNESEFARLHVIFFDWNLCQTAALLKAGTMQLVLALIEARRITPQVFLDNTLLALRQFSRSPDLNACAYDITGRRLSALNLQRIFWTAAKEFVDEGLAEGIVPRAREIIETWDEVLSQLEARDWDGLQGKLDWVLKKAIIDGILGESRGGEWDHDLAKMTDFSYGDLCPENGLFWDIEAEGGAALVVPDEHVYDMLQRPPTDTRAWLRGSILGAVADELYDVDWDSITFYRGKGKDEKRYSIEMPNPLDPCRERCEGLLAAEDVLGAFVLAGVAKVDDWYSKYGGQYGSYGKYGTAAAGRAHASRVRSHFDITGEFAELGAIEYDAELWQDDGDDDDLMPPSGGWH